MVPPSPTLPVSRSCACYSGVGDRIADVIAYVRGWPGGVTLTNVAQALNIDTTQAGVYLSRAVQAKRLNRPLINPTVKTPRCRRPACCARPGGRARACRPARTCAVAIGTDHPTALRAISAPAPRAFPECPRP